MSVSTRLFGFGRAVTGSAVVRLRIGLALAPVIALLGVAVAPALPVQAAITCHYSFNPNATVRVQIRGGVTATLTGQTFAGQYGGLTVIPSSTLVTSAGAEAQCLLKREASRFNDPRLDPGTIDGVFGSHSQAAARELQTMANNEGGVVAVDGTVGPQTWPWLRWFGT